MFSPLPRALGFCKINCGFFGKQKVFCQTVFTNMATRFVKITDDDVEILTEREENENTRKPPQNYVEHSSANMKQVVSLEMESIERSHKSLPSTSSTALFHGINWGNI